MTTPLFSTYRQGENRVTETFLAVLQRLSLPNMDRIIRALLQDGEFSFLAFTNQLKGDGSVPDAEIRSGQSIVIETKTSHDKVSRSQLKKHLRVVGNDEKLLVLTPDESKPLLLSEDPFVNDERLVWSNFITLAGVIEAILNDEDDENEPPTEREAFLLREFVRMLQQDGLLFSAKDRVLIIAAGKTWPLYPYLRAYVTRPKSHRPSDHLAFYAGGKIQRIVPKIKLTLDSVNLTENGISQLCGEQKSLATKLRQDILEHPELGIDYGVSDGFTAKVFF